jgi:hypothetical protein
VARLAAASAAEREAMGRLGRAYYADHFDRDRLLLQLEAWLRELHASRNGR